jgi:hypothetical protein
VITELNVLLEFLHTSYQISGNNYLKHDYEALKNRIDYAFHPEWIKLSWRPTRPRAVQKLALGLKGLFDAIKSGINMGVFKLPSDITRYWAKISIHSPLPRFLSTVTTRIFDPVTGILKSSPDYFAVEFVISSLMLVKRISLDVPALMVPAHNKAINQFKDEQRSKATLNKHVWSSLRTILQLFIDEGSPVPSYVPNGPGKVLDVDDETYIPQYCIARATKATRGTEAQKFLDEAYLNFFGTSTPYKFRKDSGGLVHLKEHPANITIVPLVLGPTIKVITVPKTVEKLRAIGLAPAGYIQVSKVLWDYIFQAVHNLGFADVMNVHDQSLSQNALVEFFQQIALYDIKGGSGCLLYQFLDYILPTQIKQVYKEIRPKFAKLVFLNKKGNSMTPEIIEVLTGQQGSPDMVAILTWILAMLQALSVITYERAHSPLECDFIHYGASHKYRFKSSPRRERLKATFGQRPELLLWRPITRSELLKTLAKMKDERTFHQVGDDVVIPKTYAETFRRFSEMCHIFINRDKSSFSDGFQVAETCGTCVIGDQHHHRVISYQRAPVGQKRIEGALSASSFMYRLKGDNSLLPIYAETFAKLFDPSFQTGESYTQNEIGTPVPGGLPPSTVRSRTRVKHTIIGDDLAYDFHVISGGNKSNRYNAKQFEEPGFDLRVSVTGAAARRSRTSYHINQYSLFGNSGHHCHPSSAQLREYALQRFHADRVISDGSAIRSVGRQQIRKLLSGDNSLERLYGKDHADYCAQVYKNLSNFGLQSSEGFIV